MSNSTTGRPRRAAANRKSAVISSSDSESDYTGNVMSPILRQPKRKVASKKSTNSLDESYNPTKILSPKSDVKSTIKKGRNRIDIGSSSSSDSENSPKNKRINPVKKTATKKSVTTKTKTATKTSTAIPKKRVAVKREVLRSDSEPEPDTADIPPLPKRKKINSIAVKNEEWPDSKLANKQTKVETKTDAIDGASSSKNKLMTETTSAVNRLSNRFGQPIKTWTEAELLAQLQNLDYPTAKNIIRLFEDDNTIPFICRYRKEAIGDLNPDQLRDIKITYNHVLNVKSRQHTVIQNLEKENHINDEIRGQILCAKSLDEIDHLYAPFKPASKGSLFERAKALGLLEPAEHILYGDLAYPVDLNQFVDIQIEGLDALEKIEAGIKQITAHIISKDTKVLEEIRILHNRHCIMLQSKPAPVKKSETKRTNDARKAETSANKPATDPTKFETYFEFRNPIKYVKPHQTLAINRGENLKVLTVKVDVPDSLRIDLYNFARKEFLSVGFVSLERRQMFDKSFDEAYNKKLQPLICRQVRSELTKLAEAASIEVFATNLKQLLLMSPVKGQRILGIDPGFSNGCKVALISECTDVIETDVIYPHTRLDKYLWYGERIARMMQEHNCKLIALGNGTACRETERWIADLFGNNILDINQVKYSIVTEQGASIYSCGDIAKKEFPNLDVNLISAVSIARRLSDPLGEFVKVEPKHLGVGMYQHDVNDKLLTESLNEVVMECVSFVGVDINTASVTLLQHVAGLTAIRATNIIKYRTENGPFKSREQLKKVKQIGEKTFVQCAGFVRIEPLTAGTNNYNLLDSTWVHPESYDLAKQIIRSSGCNMQEIGSPSCIAAVKAFALGNSTEKLSQTFGKPVERVQCVLDALQRELLRDYRADFDKRPLFKQGLTRMADLQEGTVVSGAITNTTHFGCFVDIGVEKDGLIHVSKLGGMKPNIGDRIEASVTQVDIARGRIQLKLLKIC